MFILALAKFWLSDGTFRTLPTLLYQLYSIHASVGSKNNSQICPLVFALMNKKSQQAYELLFNGLIEICDEIEIVLDPGIIITDFELAAMNAFTVCFPNAKGKCCLFHWGQIVWRKIRDEGLATEYGKNLEFAVFMRQLVALAFLTPSEIIPTFVKLQKIALQKVGAGEFPNGTLNVFQLIDELYVRGVPLKKQRNQQQKFKPPRFKPTSWSIAQNNKLDIPRTSNSVEAFHRRWQNLVGTTHIGVFKFVEELQLEQNVIEGKIIGINAGAPRPPQSKELLARKERIKNVIQNSKTIAKIDFVKNIAMNLVI